MTEELGIVQGQSSDPDEFDKQAADTATDGLKTSDGEVVTTEPDAEWELEIPLKDVTYKLRISADQRVRLRSIIRPKPKPQGNEQLVLADHKFSVENVWLLVVNLINEQIEHHDSKKLEEGEDHATVQPHHWPLDGYDCSDGYLPVTFFIEAVCDYIATIIGRAEAGRELGWMSPTNSISAADVLTSTVLAVFDYYGLATITPTLKNSGVMQ